MIILSYNIYHTSSEADTSNKFVSSEPELADSLTDHTDGKGGSSFTIQTTVLGHSIHNTRVFTVIYTIKKAKIHTRTYTIQILVERVYTRSVFVKYKLVLF